MYGRSGCILGHISVTTQGYRLQICRSTSSKVVVGNGHLISKTIVSAMQFMVGFVVDGHIYMYIHVPGCVWRGCQAAEQYKLLQLSPPYGDQLDGELQVHTHTTKEIIIITVHPRVRRAKPSYSAQSSD